MVLQDDTDSMYSLLGLRRPGSDMDLSLSLSDVALASVKQEPHNLSDAEINAIAKDRQKKDNHNMSTCTGACYSAAAILDLARL